MQRVAIARALVNNPEIILADEPTGALDSETSLQVMELLKEVAKDKLVIMVTHNRELAEQYSTRIVSLVDGLVVSDTMPYEETEAGEHKLDQNPAAADATATPRLLKNRGDKKAFKKTSMSFFTAFALSLRNLLTKKGRTFMTAFAGSIGIVGIALVLALSNGFTLYINRLQSDTLSGYPVTVSPTSVDVEGMMNTMQGGIRVDYEKLPDGDELIPYDPSTMVGGMVGANIVTEEYAEYIEGLKNVTVDKELPYNYIQKNYAVPLNILTKSANGYVKVPTPDNSGLLNITMESVSSTVMGSGDVFQQLMGNRDFLLTQYDVLYGEFPQTATDLVLIVDNYNRISVSTLASLGIETKMDGEDQLEKIKFEELIGKEYKLIYNDQYYTYVESDDYFAEPEEKNFAGVYGAAENLTLKISGVIRKNPTTPLGIYNTGLGFLPTLYDELLANSKTSELATRQRAQENWVYINTNIGGVPYNKVPNYLIKAMVSKFSGRKLENSEIKYLSLQYTGAVDIPNGFNIYPKNFDSKKAINDYLNAWNAMPGHENEPVRFTDAASILSSTMGQMVDIISYVLITFASISLIVSSIMIGIITYVSVIERTKEIGVLRSIGARKKDIAQVFNAETILIGLIAGLFGVLISYLLCIPLNLIIKALAGAMVVSNLVIFNPLHALLLVAVSVLLTFVSGLIPSQIAAKKDPVEALRSE